MTIPFILNGEDVLIQTDPGERLVTVLRNDFHLLGTKEGCMTGRCGSCAVICNGKVVPSCMLAMFQVSGSEIITIEGFSQTTEYKLIIQGFEEAGVQMCGYCNTGKILTAYTFFEKKAQPDDTEIIKAYSGTMCRCTNISDIVRGVKNALKLKAGKNI